LANTHLFFHPTADFTRLLQSIVCAKFVEKLKFDLIAHDFNVKEACILFGGDFNSDPPSHAFTYLFTQSIPFENLTEGI
jgi:2',5'-phosphodiesterase